MNWPVHAERGQNTLEYVGFTILVAGVVAATMASPVLDGLPRKFRCAVQGVVTGTGCVPGTKNDAAVTAAGPTPTGPSGDGGTANPEPAGGPNNLAAPNPTGGPALEGGAGDIPVLPFPGAASKKVGVNTKTGVKASVTKTHSRSEPNTKVVRIDTDGDGTPDTKVLRKEVRLKISTTSEVGVTVGADGRIIGGSASKSKGQQSTYQVTVTEKQADRIESGKMNAPNPFDPRSIPRGGSLILSKETYAKYGLSASYRLLYADTYEKKGHKMSTGVRRTGKDEVTIFVGDTNLVENAATFGLGVNGLSLGLEKKNGASTGTIRQLKLDISTKEGWQAYQEFLRTGKLPGKDEPGVTGRAEIKTTKIGGEKSIKGTLGPLALDIPLDSAKATWTQKTNADGTRVNTYAYDLGDVTITTNTRTTPGGQKKTEYGVLLTNVHPGYAGSYLELRGLGERKYGKPQDIYLTFTKQDLKALKSQSYAYLANQCRTTQQCSNIPEPPKDIRDVPGWMKKYGDNREVRAYSPLNKKPMLAAIAYADNPQDIIVAMAAKNRGSGKGNSTDLLNSLMQRAGSLPGSPPGDWMRGEIAIMQPSG